MALDRGNEEYSRRDRNKPGPGMGPQDMIRYGVAIMGVGLIALGVLFAVQVFRVVLNVIESPDTFVANLDAWSNVEPEEETPATAAEVPASPPAPTADAPGSKENAPDAAAAPTDVDATTPPEAQSNNPFGNFNRPDNRTDAPSAEPTTQPEEWERSFAEFVDLVREGRMGRVAGAVIIVLLLSLLAKIPFTFMRIGAQLLSAAVKFKVSNSGQG